MTALPVIAQAGPEVADQPDAVQPDAVQDALPTVLPEDSAAPPAWSARVTGWSVHLPAASAAALRASLPRDVVQHLPGPVLDGACGPGEAASVLGRKGLLYKEPATRLALCAVHRALRMPAGTKPSGQPDVSTAVVVASNLGNVQTVAEVTRTVAEQGGRAVSPLAAPNASSNVIASTVALWFRLGGPNLMVTSGATAGLDAVDLALLLLRAGRADRVIVVGAEPDDEVASALHDGRGAGLRSGAACVVLSGVSPSRPGTAPSAGARPDDGQNDGHDVPGGAVVLGPLGRLPSGHPVPPLVRLPGGSTHGPGAPGPVSWYGADGVLALALAAALVDAGLDGADVACGDGVDGVRTASVRRHR